MIIFSNFIGKFVILNFSNIICDYDIENYFNNIIYVHDKDQLENLKSSIKQLVTIDHNFVQIKAAYAISANFNSYIKSTIKSLDKIREILSSKLFNLNEKNNEKNENLLVLHKETSLELINPQEIM